MKPRHAFLIMAALMLLAPGAQAQDLHGSWDKLLQAHVSEGEVNYAAIRKHPAELNDYIKTLGNTDPANMTQTDQLAFWINAYNAFTVKLIIDNMPLKSIRDIKSPWKQKNWHVGDRVLSLNQIEHEILRKDFKEPRIHFAIVCASIGCPDLQNRAFLGTTIKAQLTNATREFMASPKHIRTEYRTRSFGRKDPVLHISQIFKWFPGDFTDSGQLSIPEFIARYAPAKTAQFISEADKRLRLDHLHYDWNLNKKSE